MNSAARTDLLGAHRTEALARAQYRSLRSLAELPDHTALWPTHGAGSFCSAVQGDERTSTIGAQKQSNPLLAAPDEDTFVRQLVAGLGAYPGYFDRLAEANRRGSAVLTSAPLLPALDAGQVKALPASGGQVVDVRTAADYAAGHIPGALIASVSDHAHPAWHANALGTYRFWRDIGYAAGALVAGILADAFGLNATVIAAAVLTAGSGLLVARWITEHPTHR
ncbi:rhodanese-like domain-containing protein [Streptomyces sp. NPDC050448]|uniref:rhodanese-like domain-containing protein n=1 Tax=Streptomyces sp. NPDC050448 TaxID=3155404 RepID=UPI00341E6CCD